MRREDFIFTIGYDADTAIIDGKAKKKYGKLDTAQLAEAGLLKAAFCSALFTGDETEFALVLDAYNKGHGTAYTTADELKRLFGVYEVRKDIEKTRSL